MFIYHSTVMLCKLFFWLAHTYTSPSEDSLFYFILVQNSLINYFTYVVYFYNMLSVRELYFYKILTKFLIYISDSNFFCTKRVTDNGTRKMKQLKLNKGIIIIYNIYIIVLNLKVTRSID